MSAEWKIWSPACKKTVKYLLRKNPEERIDLGQIFNLKWVKFHKEKNMKFYDCFSTNEYTKILSVTKDNSNLSKKAQLQSINTFSELNTKKIFEKEKRATEISIEPKTLNLEKFLDAKIPKTSNLLSKIPSFLENHQVLKQKSPL